MTISVNGVSRVITVPKADTTFDSTDPVSGREIRRYNLDTLRRELRVWEESEEGRGFHLRTHDFNEAVTISGTPLGRVIIMINNFQVEFEDGQYAVIFDGANSNVGDVAVVNQVQIRPQNTAGLTDPTLINAVVEGILTQKDVLKILLAVAAGKSNIIDLGNGQATVEFRDQADSKDRVVGTMDGSKRTNVVIDTS